MFEILVLPLIILGQLLTLVGRCVASGLRWADTHNGMVTAFASIAIGVFTWRLWVTSNQQWQTMQQQLALSERPWVKMDLNTVGISDPLTFNEKGGFVRIQGDIKNTGNSVALHTMVRVRIMDESQLPHDWENKDAPLCGQGTEPPQDVGNILFPTDQIQFNEPAEFYPSDIKSGLAHSHIKGRVSPLAIICISYQSAFEKSYHRTQYLFFLGTPMVMGFMGSFEPKGSLENVRLIRSFWGNMAD